MNMHTTTFFLIEWPSVMWDICGQIRTLCYGSQLVGGVLSEKPGLSSAQLGKSLLLFSAQLSHCRTVLRLFDDLSMLTYSQSYGLGAGVSNETIAAFPNLGPLDP